MTACGGGTESPLAAQPAAAPPQALDDAAHAATVEAARATLRQTLGTAPPGCLDPAPGPMTRRPWHAEAAGVLNLLTLTGCQGEMELLEAVPASLVGAADAQVAEPPLLLLLPAGASAVTSVDGDGDGDGNGDDGDGDGDGDGDDRGDGAWGVDAATEAAARAWWEAGWRVWMPRGRRALPWAGWSPLGRWLADDLSAARHAAGGHPGACRVAAGLGLGGTRALMLGAFDAPMDMLAAADGLATLADDPQALTRWADAANPAAPWPALAPWLRAAAPRAMPFDFDRLLALASPRRLWLMQAQAGGPEEGGIAALVQRAQGWRRAEAAAEIELQWRSPAQPAQDALAAQATAVRAVCEAKARRRIAGSPPARP